MGRITLIANSPNVGTVSYTYDANGNKLTESWSGAGNMSNWNFTTENGADDGYDAEDRFLRFDRPTQNEEFTWARSDIGNIGNISLESNLFQARSYNELHQLKSVASVTQVFNADMQMTTTHTGLTPLTWDPSGQLKQVVVPAAATAGLEGTHSYGYDASGRRVWKNKDVTNGTDEHLVFIYSGPNCIAEYHAGDDPSTADPQRQYVYGTAIDELLLIDTGSQKLGVTRNQQWSLTALYDNSDGTVVERYTYDMFGTRRVLNPDATDTQSPLSTVGNPYGYTSRRHDDETGLMYFRARYYDPTTGEFISKDPLGYVDGMSLYRGYFIPKNLDPYGVTSTYDDGVILDNNRVKDPAGPKTGKICAVPLIDKETGRPADRWVAEAKLAGDCVLVKGARTQQEILDFVEKCGCCTLYTFGHQGTDAVNPGGTVSNGETIFPSEVTEGEGFEVRLKKLFSTPPCSGKCIINILACGGMSQDHKDTRQSIADRTGCLVCGSTCKTTIGGSNPGQVEGYNCTVGPTCSGTGVIPGIEIGGVKMSDSTYCWTRTPWKYDCAKPKGGFWSRECLKVKIVTDANGNQYSTCPEFDWVFKPSR